MEGGAIDVRHYLTRDGRAPFMEWLAALKDVTVRAAIAVKVGRIRLGLLGDHKSVGDGVQEIRIHSGPGFRIYYGWDGPAIVILLRGGDKGSQQRDITKAKEYWVDYRSRTDG